MNHHELYKRVPNGLLITAAVFVSVIFIITALGLILAEGYRYRITPGVQAAGERIGGKTPAEARKMLEAKTAALLANGFTVSYADKSITVPPENIDSNPDAASMPMSFDVDETLNQAWSIGHGNNWLTNFFDQAGSLIAGRPIELAVVANQEAIMSLLQKEFEAYHAPAKNAAFVFASGAVTITPETSGHILDYEGAVIELMDHFRTGDTQPIIIQSQTDKPSITRADAESVVKMIDSFLDVPKKTAVYKEAKWSLTKNILRGWLGIAKDNGAPRLIFDKEKIKEFISKTIGPKVNRDPNDAKLTMDNGRVSVWQAGQSGLAVDEEATAEKLASLKDSPDENIEIVVKEIPSNTLDANAEELGLKEIIGTGTSQFNGSPANRRHNIRVGANALNGLLIKPGEEFSLLRALGPIDGKHGYLPELVIKENKTTPEYGGGLCQIGTTVFRATFNSGLPVTQRRNHSYRVVYYEPAGTDATIYDPAPDYRFVNDTGHYILIQTRIEGTTLFFDFWGTKDGRNIEFTKPVIYNIVKPAPTKIVETTDLKEGEKKCTESAHAGADAYFDYKVTYPTGEIKQKRFTSHYIPWQAVCLVGVKKAPETPKPGEPNGGTPATPTGTVTPTAQ